MVEGGDDGPAGPILVRGAASLRAYLLLVVQWTDCAPLVQPGRFGGWMRAGYRSALGRSAITSDTIGSSSCAANAKRRPRSERVG